jgi:hypothetical protein
MIFRSVRRCLSDVLEKDRKLTPSKAPPPRERFRPARRPARPGPGRGCGGGAAAAPNFQAPAPTANSSAESAVPSVRRLMCPC